MSRRHLVIFLVLVLAAVFGAGLGIKRLMERHGTGRRKKRKRPSPSAK